MILSKERESKSETRKISKGFNLINEFEIILIMIDIEKSTDVYK